MEKYNNSHNNNFSNYRNQNNISNVNYYEDSDKVINGENLNIDSTLEQISKEMHPGETLILDIGNNYFHQADEIFDTLVLKGYDVKKTFRNGRNQILVHKKSDFLK